MSRASRARRIAAAAAYGGGGLTFLTAAGIGLVSLEAQLARRAIGQPFGAAGPEADGVYGHGPGVRQVERMQPLVEGRDRLAGFGVVVGQLTEVRLRLGRDHRQLPGGQP